MIEFNVISKIFKKHINHNYNYLINKRYNLIVKKFVDKILGYKKKNYIYFINIKNFNNYLTNNINIIRGERLTSLVKKIERKFV